MSDGDSSPLAKVRWLPVWRSEAAVLHLQELIRQWDIPTDRLYCFARIAELPWASEATELERFFEATDLLSDFGIDMDYAYAAEVPDLGDVVFVARDELNRVGAMPPSWR